MMRRICRVRVAGELMVQLLRAEAPLIGRVTVANGLPYDARVVGVHMADDRGGGVVELIFESPALDPVEEGDTPPMLIPEYTREAE